MTQEKKFSHIEQPSQAHGVLASRRSFDANGDDPEIPVRVLFLKPDEAEHFWKLLERDGLKYPYLRQGKADTLHLSPGIVLKESLVRGFLRGANVVRNVALSIINQSASSLNDHLSKRPLLFAGKTLFDKRINKQLRAHVKNGMSLPIAYDLIATVAKDGTLEWKCVEIQICPSGYAGWFDMFSRIITEVKPELSNNTKYQRAIGDPLSRMNLKKLTNGEEILVMDVEPWKEVTYPDQIAQAKILGDDTSIPVSVLDVRRGSSESGWVVDVRDPKTEKIIGERPLNNVLPRMCPEDIKVLEKKTDGNPERQKHIYDFLTDHRVNWLWHPSWYLLIAKQDMPMLMRHAETKAHASTVFNEGEIITEDGVFYFKPIEGNSGKGITSRPVVAGEKRWFQQITSRKKN